MTLNKPRAGWYRVYATCPECEDADIPLNFNPGWAAQTYGPPERCFPAEGPEIDFDPECPECGAELEEHYDRLLEQAAEEMFSDY